MDDVSLNLIYPQCLKDRTSDAELTPFPKRKVPSVHVDLSTCTRLTTLDHDFARAAASHR